MDARRGSPVYRLRLMFGDAPVQVTVIGADAATAEDAADLLTDLLTRWNLDDPRSALSKLWRAGAADGVGDATLLLLHLGTTARVDLRAGAVTLPTPTAPPDPDLVRALAVDIVVQDLLDNEAVGACVAIGSHIRVAGAAPTSAGWLVPGPPPGLSGQVRLHDGAMVTVERAYGESRRAVTAAMPTAWAAAAAAVAAVGAADGLEQGGQGGRPGEEGRVTPGNLLHAIPRDHRGMDRADDHRGAPLGRHVPCRRQSCPVPRALLPRPFRPG